MWGQTHHRCLRRLGGIRICPLWRHFFCSCSMMLAWFNIISFVVVISFKFTIRYFEIYSIILELGQVRMVSGISILFMFFMVISIHIFWNHFLDVTVLSSYHITLPSANKLPYSNTSLTKVSNSNTQQNHSPPIFSKTPHHLPKPNSNLKVFHRQDLILSANLSFLKILIIMYQFVIHNLYCIVLHLFNLCIIRVFLKVFDVLMRLLFWKIIWRSLCLFRGLGLGVGREHEVGPVLGIVLELGMNELIFEFGGSRRSLLIVVKGCILHGKY